MAIEELLRVVAPPRDPLATGDMVRWAEVERMLGTRLPQDYRDFATRYGSGRFLRPFDLAVLNPFSASYPACLRELSDLLRDRRGLPDQHNIPYGVFPDRPGWLLWGVSDGDSFCWVTEGEPDAWPVLIISDRTSFQQLQMPMTTFLTRLFSEQLQLFFVIHGGITFHQPPRFVASRPPEHLATGSPQPPAPVWGPGANRPPCPWEGEWFPPDELGRPTGARVVMGPGTGNSRWNGFAAETFTVYPAWWHELPAPRHRWRRGLLLGWRLGGPAGTALHNLVPLTWKAQTILWAQEGGVALAVFSGARMSYSVRTTYEGTNRYPSGVTLEYRFLPGFPGSGGAGPLTIDNT